MANTFELIASTTLSSAQRDIEFTSIPATFTDLKLVFSTRFSGTAGNYFLVFFNSDTSSANYSSKELTADGSTASSGGWTTVSYWGFSPQSSFTADTFGNAEMYIPNYANTSYQKSASVDSVTENNASTSFIDLNAGKWTGTAAIHTIRLRPDATMNWVQYSSAYLYGIKNS